MTIKANQDNDLKYRLSIDPEDPEKDKKKEQPVSESGTTNNSEAVELFTE